MKKEAKGNNDLEIKINITKCSDEYRIAIYRMLNQLHFQNPDVFNYRTTIQNPSLEDFNKKSTVEIYKK